MRTVYDEYDELTPEEERELEEKKKKKRVAVKELKHFLKSAWYWQKKKDLLSDKIQILRSRAEKITTSYSDAPTFGGFDDHRQAVIAEMVDTQKKYAKAMQECDSKLADIQFFIGSLEDYQERIVLEYRYIYFYGWIDIAIRLDYSIQNVTKIHGRALVNLLAIHQKMIENGGKGLF